MVRQDPGTRSSSPGRTALSATGSAAAGASASATRFADREPQASCREIASPDSFDRSDSCSLAGCAAAVAPPFPYQAPAVGLQWPPRITRNSDRPRASNRTMVDTQIPGPLAKFMTRLASSPPEDESHGNGKQAKTNLSSKSRGTLTGQWAGSRDKNLLGVRSRGNFSLDIPFYRTH